MHSKKAKTAVAKVVLENVGKGLETKAGPAMEQVAADNSPVATVIPPETSEPQPTVTERLATPEPVTGVDASGADIVGEARAPIPPLSQTASTRKALDDAVKADIIVMLSAPGANMTKIANEMGVSYGTVQSIKSKLGKPTSAAKAPRAVVPKAPVRDGSLGLLLTGDGIKLINDRDIELMQLELDYLRRRVAILEKR